MSTTRPVERFEPSDHITRWHARLLIPGTLAEEIWPDHPPLDKGDADDSQSPASTLHHLYSDDHVVAKAQVCAVRLYAGSNLFEVLDCDSADMTKFISLTDGDYLTEDLEESIEGFGSQLVILERAIVSPEWRGLHLGPLVAALALEAVGGDARLFACHPGAFEFEQGTIERDTADKRLANLWTKFGFTIPHGSLLLADPAVTDWGAMAEKLCGED